MRPKNKSLVCKFALITLCMNGHLSFAQHKINLIWKTAQYSIFSDSVVQGNQFVARALSDREIISNYQSPANQLQSSSIAFKFSINGKDNEMLPGVNHQLDVTAGVTETPVIVFGQPLIQQPVAIKSLLAADSKLKLRVDMNSVLDEFKTKGYFTTFKGDKIYKEDFKGLFVAGNTLPMIWDFDNLHTKEGLQLTDPDGDGIYETDLVLNTQKDEKQTDASWKLSKDISAFPQYQSGSVLADAIYNMSLEEMEKAVEPDSTFRTGKEWAGVWTRDISYSIILSMAHLQPEVAKKSLMRKVNNKKKIIQDTGTGGAYPCSTDRMIWATAAWEIYKVTGDKDWLQQAYVIIKNSIEDDMDNAYDPITGMVKGESSFLDWREQTYPKWMQPADIYESENLGTNAVHYQANMVLAQMAGLIKKPADAVRYKANAAKIKTGINQYLWMEAKGYYGQYLYGRNFKIRSPRSEALGEALCILFDIAGAEKQNSIVAKTPLTDYGITCIYPQIPNLPPYHNNAVWPFVQSYWALAAARAGNEQSVMESIAAIYRPSALFLTNKENFVADNGDFAGTVINSSNMLWSLSGNLAIVHKLLFGINFEANQLLFKPFVPEALQGKRSLTNFKYRKAILDITVEGFGSSIRSFMLDGKAMNTHRVPENLSGKHTVSIVLNNAFPKKSAIIKVANLTTPSNPVVTMERGVLTWQQVEQATGYTVYRNGKILKKLVQPGMPLPANDCGEYQVVAIGAKGLESFASEPLVNGCSKPLQYQMEKFAAPATLEYKGFLGDGFVEISQSVNKKLSILVVIKQPGTYAISFRYSNGNGPVNTENKCAIRTVRVDDKKAGTVIFPQRGTAEWSNWGFSNAVMVNLLPGKHTITVTFEPANENMNEEVNQAMLDYLQLNKIK